MGLLLLFSTCFIISIIIYRCYGDNIYLFFSSMFNIVFYIVFIANILYDNHTYKYYDAYKQGLITVPTHPNKYSINMEIQTARLNHTNFWNGIFYSKKLAECEYLDTDSIL